MAGPGVLEPGLGNVQLWPSRSVRTTEDHGLRVLCVAANSAEGDPCPVSRGHTPTYAGVRGLLNPRGYGGEQVHPHT